MSDPNTNPRKRSASPLADDAPGDGQEGRQRSRAACTPCRQRKRKCDGRYPCGTCVRYEYECIFATTPTTTTTQKRLSYAAAANGDVAPELTRSPEAVVRTTPSIIHLQKHPLTAPGARFHHRSMMDPVKTRFVRANSAIAFPRILGMDLESESIPRLHSFAWHCGIRAEVLEPVVDVTTLLSWPDLTRLAKVYFRVVNTEFGILDETDFLELSAARFGNSQGLNDVDAVLLGVVALGSFFSPNGHPKEHDFVLGARDLLTQKSVNHPTTNNVTGWILRTIYLRLTSRPHALNIVLSFEYGRSRVGFDVITTKRFAPDHGGFAHQFVELAELLPNDFVDREREPDPPGSLCTALTKIEDLKTDSAFIQLLKADLTFAIYRRLWLMSLTDAKDRADSVLSIGRAALEASARLLETKTSWWNLVHAPFQFLCCVLAIATPRALAHVKDAMALLHRIAQTYDTHMTREAYNQAAILVQMSRRRKERELQALNAVPEPPPFNDDHHRSSSVGGSSIVGLTDIPNFDWAMDLPFEWETFLNPELVMSSMQQVQGQSQALPPGLMQAGSYESQASYGNENLQYRASQGACP
ncbi:hypothetical protein LTR74_016817 [Friedmanniomyces endolithicus]|nr:hypothetical protein LTR74_016817 [Friedmanniomyces endolithicus]